MNEQDFVMQSQSLSLFALPDILKMLVSSLCAFLVVHFDTSKALMKRLPFFGATILCVFVIGFIVGALGMAFGINLLTDETPVSNVIMAISSCITSAAIAWYVVRRVRDAGHEKAIAYFSCIPAVGGFVTLYLLFAKPKPQGRG